MLLLSVITVNSLDDIDGQTFTDVLDDLARDSLGLQEIQVTTRIHTPTHAYIPHALLILCTVAHVIFVSHFCDHL